MDMVMVMVLVMVMVSQCPLTLDRVYTCWL